MDYVDFDGLINLIGNNDLDALEKLFDILNKDVYFLAYSILNDSMIAEDVVQDTFIKVRQNAGKFTSKGYGKTWIMKIARNVSISIYRRRKNEVSFDSGYETYCDNDKYQEDDIIENLLLKEAFKCLDQKEREIVFLKASSGFLHKEISKIMGLPLGTIKWKYSRAIDKLSKQLIELGVNETGGVK